MKRAEEMHHHYWWCECVGSSKNVTPWVRADLISSLFTDGSYRAPENETSHIFPCIVFLPPFTRDGDVTRRPTTQLLFPLTSLAANHSPETQYFSDSAFVSGLHCEASVPGVALIYIMSGTARKSFNWNQAENEIITLIKPELHILHHHVTGKKGLTGWFW